MARGRALRRHHTRRVCRNRRNLHLALSYDLSVDDLSVGRLGKWASPTWYDKRCLFGCNCSSKTPGRPRLSHGICRGGMRPRIYNWRREATRIAHLSRGYADVDWDSDEVVLATSRTEWPY